MEEERFCKCGCGTKLEGWLKNVAYGHLKAYIEVLRNTKKFCACGCGKEVKQNLKKGTVVNFILGHNKGHNMKHSDVTKKKIRQKCKAKFDDPEFKEKFKIRMKQACSTPEARENNRRAQNRPEVKAKIIKGLKEFYADPINNANLRKRCKEASNRPEVKAKTKATLEIPEVKERIRLKRLEVASRPEVREHHRISYQRVRDKTIASLKIAMNRPEVKEKLAKSRAKLIAEGKMKPGRVFNTAPELLMQKALIKRGYVLGQTLISQFHCQKVGMVDLCIPEKKILIEVDGDYWHCNPNKYSSDYFHTGKMLTAQQIWDKDKQKNEISKELGYKMIRFWESDIYKDIDSCILKIENETK
jgi:very-short-patch-repair endonuclease